MRSGSRADVTAPTVAGSSGRARRCGALHLTPPRPLVHVTPTGDRAQRVRRGDEGPQRDPLVPRRPRGPFWPTASPDCVYLAASGSPRRPRRSGPWLVGAGRCHRPRRGHLRLRIAAPSVFAGTTPTCRRLRSERPRPTRPISASTSRRERRSTHSHPRRHLWLLGASPLYRARCVDATIARASIRSPTSPRVDRGRRGAFRVATATARHLLTPPATRRALDPSNALDGGTRTGTMRPPDWGGRDRLHAASRCRGRHFESVYGGVVLLSKRPRQLVDQRRPSEPRNRCREHRYRRADRSRATGRARLPRGPRAVRLLDRITLRITKPGSSPRHRRPVRPWSRLRRGRAPRTYTVQGGDAGSPKLAHTGPR